MTREDFEHIAPQLREVMLSVGRQFFGNEPDAEDVAQEGMLTMFKYLERMDVAREHRAFAVRIAKHCCINLMRKRGGATFVPIDSVYRSPDSLVGSSPHEELVAKEMTKAVTESIGRLNPSERRLFELRQIEGSSLDDIARQTGIAKSSIKSMLSVARKKVFNELKERMKP